MNEDALVGESGATQYPRYSPQMPTAARFSSFPSSSSSKPIPLPHSHSTSRIDSHHNHTHDRTYPPFEHRTSLDGGYVHSVDMDEHDHDRDHDHDDELGLELDGEAEADGDVSRDGEVDGHHVRDGRSSSPDTGKGGADGTSVKKKPRITLARGGACVACRNRKLKCTGERPCKTCLRANIECRYEELPRKKPRAVMLEERVAELEAYLHLRPGDPVPKGDPSRPTWPMLTPTLTPPENSHASLVLGGVEMRHGASSSSDHTVSASSSSDPMPPSVSLHSHRDLPPNMAAVNTGRVDITPGSRLEAALIQVVLPYAPYLLMPIHPQRFLALLALPINNPSRPHPALLYIMFSEAVRILEQNVPLPRPPPLPTSLFPQPFTASPTNVDVHWILRQVGGTHLSMLERARKELDDGIRNVDHPYDLARAAVGIARSLYSLGRFIEGWNIPTSRLVISCGLHRLTGAFLSPDGSPSPGEAPAQGPDILPKPYAPAYHYRHSHSLDSVNSALPVIRMRPVIIPPARDEIELAERVMTFWAAKAQDWEAGIGWGWTTSLDDRQCITEWGWGAGFCEPKPSKVPGPQFAIRDLYDPTSAMHTSPLPDTPYILAMKSLGLLHRASSLFDMPEANYPTARPDGRIAPSHIPALEAVQEVETALRIFRHRIPIPFADHHQPSPPLEERYEGHLDPWWIVFQANLYTAEMIMWREMAHHRPRAYETAIGCARAMVGLVQKVPADVWANVDMIVALDISLASRFLYKESDRLARSPATQAGAAMASEEAEILRGCLAKEYSAFLPMASLHALIVQRVREGWPEKEGEYERI